MQARGSGRCGHGSGGGGIDGHKRATRKGRARGCEREGEERRIPDRLAELQDWLEGGFRPPIWIMAAVAPSDLPAGIDREPSSVARSGSLLTWLLVPQWLLHLRMPNQS